MVRIVYANLGYLREIDGSLAHHIRRAHHHVFTPRSAQLRSLALVKNALKELQPDLSCFVEIDQGSLTNGFFDQFPVLREEHHLTGTIDNKYSATRKYRRLSISRGKSNAFLANRAVDFTRRYLDHGKKRLVYDIDIDGLRVLVVHCALTKRTRARQYAQISRWIDERDMPTIVVGDFNAMWGEGELEPLLRCGRLVHANRTLGPTFRFGPWRAALDICLVSADIARNCRIEIIDQPFSDHKMFNIEVDWPQGVSADTKNAGSAAA